jgi:hypothetical protein
MLLSLRSTGEASRLIFGGIARSIMRELAKWSQTIDP